MGVIGRKFLTACLALALIWWTSFFPFFVYSQEATPSAEIETVLEPSPQPSPEITPEPGPTPEPILELNPEATDSAEPLLIIEPSPSPEPESKLERIEIQPTSQSEPEVLPSPMPEPTSSLIPDQTASPTASISLWVTNSDGSFTTTNPVTLDTNYAAPFNDNLIIRFTKLPPVSETITIKEIAASLDLANGRQVGSAYEITSPMADGDFSFDLILPVPDGSDKDNLKVKYADNLDGIKTAQFVSQTQEIDSNTLTVKNLDHLTVFVVAEVTDQVCINAGSDCYQTIQEAIDEANSGDTITVSAGSYDEQVVIDTKDLIIQGAGDTTIIRPSTPAKLTNIYTYPAGALWPGTTLAGIITVKNSASTTITQLKVDGSDITSLPAGAQRLSAVIFGESGGLISNITALNIKTTGYVARTYPIDISAVTTASTVEIANNTVTDYARTAIQAQGASLTANIHDNFITGPGTIGPDNVPNGIVFIKDAVGTADHNTLHAMHHTGSSSRSGALMAYSTTGATGITFSNNEIYDTDDAVILAANATNVTVGSGNNFHDNGVGVQIENGATNNTIENNTITNSSIAGIRFEGSANPAGGGTPPGAGNVAHENSLTGNTFGVANYDTGQTFDASINWWGNATLTTVESLIEGLVTFRPYYTDTTKTILSPVISSVATTTADGIYDTGETISLTVTFSEPVNVTLAPTIALNSGGTASYVSGTGTDTLTFDYLIAGGENTPDLDYQTTDSLSVGGGSIQDIEGNNATLTLPAVGTFTGGHSLVIDTTTPTVSWETPTADALLSGTVTLKALASDTGSGVDWVRFRYQPSGGSFTVITTDSTDPYEFSWDTTSVTDGNYTLQARARDNSVKIKNANINVTVDNAPPTLLTQTNFSGWHTSNQTSIFTFTDASGISGSDTVSCDIISEGLGQTCTVLDPNICDLAGNCSHILVVSNGANIDKIPPIDPIIDSGPVEGLYSNNSSQVFGFTIEAGTFAKCQLGPSEFDFSDCDFNNAQSYVGLADGNHIFSLKSIDEAGNESNIVTRSFGIDTVAPALFDQTAFSVWYTSNQTSTFTFTDDTSGILGFDTVSCDITSEGLGQTCTVTPNVCDNAGNCNTTPVTSNGADIDKTAPLTPGTPSTTDPTNSTTQNWSWTEAVETLSGIQNYYYRITGSVIVGLTSTGSNIASFITTLGEGVYSFFVTAQDTAGNIGSESADGSLTVDTTAPSTPVITSGPTDGSFSNNSSQDFEFTIDADSLAKCYLSPVQADFLDCDFNNAQPYIGLSDGPYTFSLKAIDPAGNESASASRSFTIDTVNPTAPVATPLAGDYTSDQLVTLGSTDDNSGLAAIYYTIDDSTPDNSKTLYNGAITVDKDITIKAIAYDNAGNTSSVLEAIYGIAPVISGETTVSTTATTIAITWTTDDLATSRVIYDTVSHSDPLVLGGDFPWEKYGYAFTTDEIDNDPVDDPMTIDHYVSLSSLDSSTTYYYRTVSHGSPETVSAEKTFTTNPAGPGADMGGGSTGTAGATAGPTACTAEKPASAPSLTGASAGTNSVTLTWSEGKGPISYYLVAFGLTPGSLTYGNPNIGGSGTTSYTVTNLSGGTTYYFRVRAGNGCTPGDYSNELAVTPSGGTVSGLPGGFAEGVLGATAEEEAIPSALTLPTAGQEGQALGETQQKNAIPWWWWLSIPVIIGLWMTAKAFKR